MKKANGRETLDIWKKNSAENISLREFKLMTNLINYLKEKYSTTDQIKKDDQAQKEWRNVTNQKKKITEWNPIAFIPRERREMRRKCDVKHDLEFMKICQWKKRAKIAN